ncbi:hypothetical protein [Naasia sp. SYSU D00948]|uniref:hypothetical protein n=1 Tax=Naasia sp. SYSU D00948 TaxID=2817379 RepID=UPI001B31074E|nr:hypothetical protein [Naasia sp. SYSU D00948]
MRTLYLSGLVILDLAVLALGAAVLATMDLDKAGTLGVLASVPIVLLVLSDFPVAHISLLGARDSATAASVDRRTTVLLATGLTAAGAVPLLLITAAVDGPLALAGACAMLAGLALVYAFVVGDRVAARLRSRGAYRPAGATLVRRRSPRRSPGGVPLRGPARPSLSALDLRQPPRR